MDTRQRSILKNYLGSMNRTKFDAVFCFSIAMWIHLNHGDVGLQEFLHEICSLTSTIVIEPQPWKCYRNAVKRLKIHDKQFLYYKDLKLKDPNNDIERLIIERGFHKLKELSETIWNRKILIFNKIAC